MSEVVKYICQKCNYRWNKRPESNVKIRCPYCSSENLAVDEFNLDVEISRA